MFHTFVEREGPTKISWEYKTITFRKPRVYDPAKRDASTYAYAQAKCDGVRVLVVREADRLFVFTTVGHDLVEKHRHHPLWFKLESHLRIGEWVDGELCVPNAGREAVKTALCELDPQLEFRGFGCSWLPIDADLSKVHTTLHKRGIFVPPFCEMKWIDTLRDGLPGEDRAGRDGLVYKDSMYGAWAKHKNERTIDLIVVGIKDGKGKFEGMCGSLQCALADGRVVANVSGMDDEVRAAISGEDAYRVCVV